MYNQFSRKKTLFSVLNLSPTEQRTCSCPRDTVQIFLASCSTLENIVKGALLS